MIFHTRAMIASNGAYGNRTKIPEYLLPLPVIKFEVARKYRINYYSVNTLLELCCKVLKNENKIIPNADWQELRKILSPDSMISTDSFKVLCHIENPGSAAQYLKNKANPRSMSICSFLRAVKIIRDETTEELRFNDLRNHWNRIPPKRPSYPCVYIGKLN